MKDGFKDDEKENLENKASAEEIDDKQSQQQLIEDIHCSVTSKNDLTHEVNETEFRLMTDFVFDVKKIDNVTLIRDDGSKL